MQATVKYLTRGERVWISDWSIVHFLSGLVPHALYAYLLSFDHWISLYVLAVGACLFELFENHRSDGEFLWTGLGYTGATYSGDSLQNSVCDVLFLLLGWGVAEVVYLITSSMLALYVLLGVAAALLAMFLYLFSKERAQWAAAVPPATTPPAGLPPVPVPVVPAQASASGRGPARVRFSLSL